MIYNLTNPLDVQNARNEVAVRARYAASALHVEADVGMSLRKKMRLVCVLNPLPYALQIHRLLVRTVRNADAAADVDELKRDAYFARDFNDEVK